MAGNEVKVSEASWVWRRPVVLNPEKIDAITSRLPVKIPAEKRLGDSHHELVEKTYVLAYPLQDENLRLDYFSWNQNIEEGKSLDAGLLFIVQLKHSQDLGQWRRCYIDMKRNSHSSPLQSVDWSFGAWTTDIFYCDDTSIWHDEEATVTENAVRGVAALLALPLSSTQKSD